MAITILGISAFYHDSAACIVQDGKIIAAAQEERFTRKKHDFDFPRHAAEYCLNAANVSIDKVDYVVFYDKPVLKFERILQTYLTTAPEGFSSYAKALPLWLKEKLWIPETIKNELNYGGEVLFTEHHQSHAGSAFYPSPFEEAAILTIDGVGEWTTNSLGIGKGNEFSIIRDIKFPHSLGLLYSAFTYFTGFKVNSGEYKVMGLAPYGDAKYVQTIYDNLIDLKEDGSFHLNLKYFDYMSGLSMTNDHFAELFGGPRRKPETPLTQREMDLAKSIQVVVEEAMLRQANYLHKETGSDNLCLAGGVALNCVGNGRVLREGPFKKLWIQPAAGDAGGALGSALCVWYGYLGNKRTTDGLHDAQQNTLIGPSYSRQEILDDLAEFNPVYSELDDNSLFDTVADLLIQEKIIGWFKGRMEFGPRALGSRSIIADPRSKTMQSKMNLKIKFRESFRPFAPAVLLEHASEYFDITCESPYMLLVAPVLEKRRIKMTAEQEKLFGIAKLNVPRSDIPAVTHVDYSARVQTVEKNSHPTFYRLIETFYQKTGCAVLVNTSFNVRGEPIVCRPSEAYTCFMRTEMDYLVIENFLFKKEEQPKWQEKEAWQKKFELD
ncbi:MAG: carbamoyltransferase [SAR324 cluster bacterium]|uniref:Carbamoyltransferase n=1 Tax=SAR324 cluster bacterium TaxID=2024889 RepID=A0A7X9FSK9_9DELT|nr:carbamoyltransferase [SAR324 cluster bacterium]